LFFSFYQKVELVLALFFYQVIGIEMNASAVSDAFRNAEINGIKNCKFVCAKVSLQYSPFNLVGFYSKP
jgi:hypothetical protein